MTTAVALNPTQKFHYKYERVREALKNVMLFVDLSYIYGIARIDFLQSLDFVLIKFCLLKSVG